MPKKIKSESKDIRVAVTEIQERIELEAQKELASMTLADIKDNASFEMALAMVKRGQYHAEVDILQAMDDYNLDIISLGSMTRSIKEFTPACLNLTRLRGQLIDILYHIGRCSMGMSMVHMTGYFRNSSGVLVIDAAQNITALYDRETVYSWSTAMGDEVRRLLMLSDNDLAYAIQAIGLNMPKRQENWI